MKQIWPSNPFESVSNRSLDLVFKSSKGLNGRCFHKKSTDLLLTSKAAQFESKKRERFILSSKTLKLRFLNQKGSRRFFELVDFHLSLKGIGGAKSMPTDSHQVKSQKILFEIQNLSAKQILFAKQTLPFGFPSIESLAVEPTVVDLLAYQVNCLWVVSS